MYFTKQFEIVYLQMYLLQQRFVKYITSVNYSSDIDK